SVKVLQKSFGILDILKLCGEFIVEELYGAGSSVKCDDVRSVSRRIRISIEEYPVPNLAKLLQENFFPEFPLGKRTPGFQNLGIHISRSKGVNPSDWIVSCVRVVRSRASFDDRIGLGEAADPRVVHTMPHVDQAALAVALALGEAVTLRR